MIRMLLLGAAAGAAGTTALNAATYLDMAVRGRPTSSTPEDTVEALAGVVHARVPGDDDTRPNRLTGLGALTGIAAGVGAGARTDWSGPPAGVPPSWSARSSRRWRSRSPATAR